VLRRPSKSIHDDRFLRCDWLGSDRAVFQLHLSGHMTRPDLPNFSIGGRVAVGVIVVVVIIAMLRLFSVF
jgi:hypothetical protein